MDSFLYNYNYLIIITLTRIDYNYNKDYNKDYNKYYNKDIKYKDYNHNVLLFQKKDKCCFIYKIPNV